MELTPREKDVIALVAEGYADKEIAVKLKISPRTVHTHVNKLLLKLNARNRCKAVAIYITSTLTR